MYFLMCPLKILRKVYRFYHLLHSFVNYSFKNTLTSFIITILLQINLNQAYYMSTRNFRSSLMKGIEIVSQEDLKLKRRDDGPPLIEARVNRPLVLLFTWLGCTPNQSDKFIDLYLNKGFDVILVSFVVSEAFRWIQFSEVKSKFVTSVTIRLHSTTRK